jgi:hypothetical protein
MPWPSSVLSTLQLVVYTPSPTFWPSGWLPAFFWWDWDLNSRLHTCYSSSPFCSGYFGDEGS